MSSCYTHLAMGGLLRIAEKGMRLGSPAANWCYQDEGAIGECVLVAESCHSNTLHRLIMQKSRIDLS